MFVFIVCWTGFDFPAHTAETFVGRMHGIALNEVELLDPATPVAGDRDYVKCYLYHLSLNISWNVSI